ncbi:hypothetical protein EJ05DRAFT_138814 [Pseudovirgaria hyperparasitica]|uniref:Uncharacterized protein n=1 Tax=Pseudovirgaria hyperparasitica TaxID=470096 RepID=A0A6A6VZW1_9PEZI|nr:uncharacterized protein EJ05DRAFT_138814 [Pseudovirgaria hyperparasitica]KAF2754351.1 hypothetical protein EJ05DRAFT_138814 [Pseudovirgaria hyperparasitica]
METAFSIGVINHILYSCIYIFSSIVCHDCFSGTHIMPSLTTTQVISKTRQEEE